MKDLYKRLNRSEWGSKAKKQLSHSKKASLHRLTLEELDEIREDQTLGKQSGPNRV